MKNMYVLTALIITVFLIFMPFAAIDINDKPKESPIGTSEEQTNNDKTDTFLVYFPEEDKIKTMTATDYIWSVVAAEMPVDYEIEALKAQAVAAYTFASYRRNSRLEGKTENKYDVAATHKTDQAFISTEDAKAKWGDKYEERYEKIMSAVKSQEGRVMKYDGKIILAAYYAISSGKTENCLDIWGSDREYLTSVDSAWDKKSPEYKAQTVLTSAQISEMLKDTCEFSDQDKIEINARTEAGSVLSVTVGITAIKGTELRTALELRSANFTVEYDKDEKSYIFTTLGYGHGIGMSQFGANEMAKEGKTCDEILKHYYKGIEIF